MPHDKPDASEYMELRLPRSSNNCYPRTPGAPFPDGTPLEPAAWQGREVPLAIANVCRQLARRGPHGVYIDSIGGPDTLAELDLYELPYKVVNMIRRGKFDAAVWVVPDAVYRFSEDRGGVI